jgi:hypothetical protein
LGHRTLKAFLSRLIAQIGPTGDRHLECRIAVRSAEVQDGAQRQVPFLEIMLRVRRAVPAGQASPRRLLGPAVAALPSLVDDRVWVGYDFLRNAKAVQVYSIRRAPGKLKYLAASESAMGVFINDTAPEQAAEMRRDVR